MKGLTWLGLWGPVAAFMVVVYVVSVPVSLTPAITAWDKLVHVAAYGTFGILSMRAFHGGIRRPRVLPTLLSMLLVLSYGAFDELHQARIPGRVPSVYDWSADVLGALLALPAMLWMNRWRSPEKADRSG